MSSVQIEFQITCHIFNLNHYFICSRHRKNMLINARMLMGSFGTNTSELFCEYAVSATFHASYDPTSLHLFRLIVSVHAARDENVDKMRHVGGISRAYAVRAFCNLMSLSTFSMVRKIYPSSMPPGIAGSCAAGFRGAGGT
jgi:hypothetical protein